jgi:FtsP/CotA-like multicopper oxidase with cupredoxin domain
VLARIGGPTGIVLNGCQSRFLVLDFRGIQGIQVHQIGNDGGLLPAVVDVMAAGGLLLLANAERADLIVDFTAVAPGSYVLGNAGPDAPFNGDLSEPADPATTGRIMQFVVTPAVMADPSTPAANLVLPPIVALPAPIRTRPLALMEHMSAHHDGPAAAMLGTVHMGMAHPAMWMDPITENPNPGDTEVWEFNNLTGDAHPMHIHEVAFELVDRQAIVVGDGEPVGPHQAMTGTVSLGTTPPRPPEQYELGRKDTVVCYPGEVTRVKATFTKPGQYVWHCHIVEHEDNEMMRPFRTGPMQPGQPI